MHNNWMICISSLDWANIAEGVPTLKQHLSLLGGVSGLGVDIYLFIQLNVRRTHRYWWSMRQNLKL